MPTPDRLGAALPDVPLTAFQDKMYFAPSTIRRHGEDARFRVLSDGPPGVRETGRGFGPPAGH